jgi:O-acetyl-ADP-ribose deacetylase (regulator of RNase III)
MPSPWERIHIERGDITTFEGDAIVNAANPRLGGGGGVNGAIQAAAGPGLLAECWDRGGCPTGQARLTGGHRLKVRWVIHTVGPVWRGGFQGEEASLASCYRESLKLAATQNMTSLAFPSIATGKYGFPLGRAVTIALEEISAFLSTHDHPERITVTCFEEVTFDEYSRRLERLGERSI